MSVHPSFPVHHAITAAPLPAVIAALFLAAPAAAAPPKNIIMLIADGAGFNTLRATELWQGEAPSYAAPEWIALPMATYALRTTPTQPVAGPAGLVQDPAVVYDPSKAWSTAPQKGGASGYPYFFAGYKWLRDTDPDSANTMSAMVTGVKTYNNAINVDGNGVPLLTLPEIAKSLGKSVGSLSSVPLVHATVACGGGAHNINRNNYHEIAVEMFNAGVLDVIGGGGNPDFDAQGAPVATPNYLWIPEATWLSLKAGTLPSGVGPNWTLVEDRGAIEAMIGGTIPAKLAIIPRTFDTLQQSRTSATNPQLTAPGADPFKENVPSLLTMSQLAVDALDDNPKGFFLHIEGGAVDWAMHANQFGRMIEEHMEFLKVVEFISDYLDAGTNGNTWENTIVVITADHDHMLFGPQSDTIPFQELSDNGAGVMAGYRWHDSSHSNQLVPLYVRGHGADGLIAYADRTDAYSDGVYTFGRGNYLHQTDLGQHLINRIILGAADLNDDGSVDGTDLAVLLGGWGGQGAADLDGSGVVDGADLQLLLGAWKP